LALESALKAFLEFLGRSLSSQFLYQSILELEHPDEEIVLHSVDRRGRERRFDLKGAPMIMKELAVYADTSVDRLTGANLPDQGPVAICDINGLPWSPAEFRRKWRLVATQAGIPKKVMNMDSGKVAPRLR
jgi:hypothetical protein